MWLLTQSKQSIVHLNNIDSIDVDGHYVVASKLGEERSVVIGIYYTEKEAEEVLEDIAQFIEDSQQIPFAENTVIYITK